MRSLQRKDSSKRLSIKLDKISNGSCDNINKKLIGTSNIQNEHYAWVILLSTFFLQIIIPSIVSSYGSFLLFDQIENVSHDNEFLLWDHEITQVPIVLVAFCTLSDTWTKNFITKPGRSPKLVIISGMSLICGGFLITWIAELYEPSILIVYILSGAITGFGVSLVLQQSDHLIHSYFRGKLKIAKNALYLGYLLGFIIIPFTLEKLIIRHGALESLLMYQGIFALGIVVAFTFKHPKLKNPERTIYSKLDTTSLDDIPKKVTYSLNTLSTNNNNLDQNEDKLVIYDRELTTFKTFSKENDDSKLLVENDKHEINSEDNSKENQCVVIIESKKRETDTQTETSTINNEKNIDELRHLDIIPDKIQSNHLDVVPILEETTEYDIFEIEKLKSRKSVVYADLSEKIENQNDFKYFMNYLNIFMIPSFYKYLLLILTNKLSMITYWVLFPSLLYDQVTYLNVHHTINDVTFVTIGGLVFTVFWNCFDINKDKAKLFLALSLILAAGGFFTIAYSTTKNWLMFGGLISTTALASIHALIDTILLQSIDELKQNAFLLLNTLSGFIILTTVIIDVEYLECFQTMALLQLMTGSIWLTNLLIKLIRNEQCQ